jgi:uncharacterized protein YjeT (DUF2065 family)
MAEFIVFLTGVYMLGGGLALTITPQRMEAAIGNFADQPALSYLTGAILAPLGAAVLVAVHGFTTLPDGIATVVGAGMLAEGLLFMAAPKTMLSLAKPFLLSGASMRLVGFAVLVLATALLWLGWPV